MTCVKSSPTAGFARAAAVVDASLQLGRWLQDGVRGDVPGLMHRVATLVQTRP
jgi:hypothetical protein